MSTTFLICLILFRLCSAEMAAITTDEIRGRGSSACSCCADVQVWQQRMLARGWLSAGLSRCHLALHMQHAERKAHFSYSVLSRWLISAICDSELFSATDYAPGHHDLRRSARPACTDVDMPDDLAQPRPCPGRPFWQPDQSTYNAVDDRLVTIREACHLRASGVLARLVVVVVGVGVLVLRVRAGVAVCKPGGPGRAGAVGDGRHASGMSARAWSGSR